MITVQPEHRLTVVFTNDEERSDIVTFTSIINKCTKEAKKSGFKNMFTNEEGEVIKGLYETLNGTK